MVSLNDDSMASIEGWVINVLEANTSIPRPSWRAFDSYHNFHLRSSAAA